MNLFKHTEPGAMSIFVFYRLELLRINREDDKTLEIVYYRSDENNTLNAPSWNARVITTLSVISSQT